MDKVIVLEIPLCTNNLLCARLATSAVCSLMNFDIDTSEDIKVCVNEACLIFMGHNFSRVNLKYDMSDGLNISLSASGSCGCNAADNEDTRELSLMLIGSLVDKSEYDSSEDGIISSVKLYKRV